MPVSVIITGKESICTYANRITISFRQIYICNLFVINTLQNRIINISARRRRCSCVHAKFHQLLRSLNQIRVSLRSRSASVLFCSFGQIPIRCVGCTQVGNNPGLLHRQSFQQGATAVTTLCLHAVYRQHPKHRHK